RRPARCAIPTATSTARPGAWAGRPRPRSPRGSVKKRPGSSGSRRPAASRMPKLSVAIVALNEEERLRACLESVAWADELVVVDSGRRDKPAAIAGEFPDRVLFHPWGG